MISMKLDGLLKSPPTPQSLAQLMELGLRFGAKGTHTSRTMMLKELTLIFEACPPDTTREQYAEAVLDQNSYSQNIRTRLTTGGYAPTIAHTAACLPFHDHRYSPAIGTAKVAGETG
jgi:hypothetical protein